MNVGGYKNLTATANCSPNPCNLLGVFCATTTGGTVNIYDDASTGTGTPVTGTITLTAGTFYPVPASLSKGLYVVITNTANITVIYA